MAETIDRRTFLRNSSLIAAGVVAAGQLDLLERMTWTRRLWPGWSPTLWGDGVHNDTPGLQALIDGREVYVHGLRRAVRGLLVDIPQGTYRITETLHLRGHTSISCNGSAIMCMDVPPGTAAITFDPEVGEAAERIGKFHLPLRDFRVYGQPPVVFRRPPVLTLIK